MKIFEILEVKKEDFFLTGSRALDCDLITYSSDVSDYDYVLSIFKRQILLEYLNEQKIEVDYSVYNGGFKFFYEGNNYNVITCIDIEFKAWRESLLILKTLIQIDDKYRNALKNKMYRYSLYESLRAFCKMMIAMGE
jgi:hypothetical protein